MWLLEESSEIQNYIENWDRDIWYRDVDLCHLHIHNLHHLHDIPHLHRVGTSVDSVCF